MEKEKLTKRELLIDSISSLIRIQAKLENEIRQKDSRFNNDNLEYKLDSIKESIKDLVHTLDVYFTY